MGERLRRMTAREVEDLLKKICSSGMAFTSSRRRAVIASGGTRKRAYKLSSRNTAGARCRRARYAPSSRARKSLNQSGEVE